MLDKQTQQRALRAVALQFLINGMVVASYVPRLPEIRDALGIDLCHHVRNDQYRSHPTGEKKVVEGSLRRLTKNQRIACVIGDLRLTARKQSKCNERGQGHQTSRATFRQRDL